MDCVSIRKEIEEADDARVVVNSRAAHLSNCASCRLAADQRISLHALVQDLDRVTAPSDFGYRLTARLNAANEKVIPPKWALWSVPVSSFAYGAAAILL